MVQPVISGPPVGRPVQAPGQANGQPATTGKYGEFAKCLARRIAQDGALPANPEEGARVTLPHAQLQREISASGEAVPALAPDEQSSLLLAPGELAGWLQLVSPPGEQGVGVAEAPGASASASGAAREVAQLLERWVRRVGLGGDARRGVARLEIGAGRFAGGELLVVAEAGHVSVELELPTAAPRGLAERLRERLEGRGLGAEVTVR